MPLCASINTTMNLTNALKLMHAINSPLHTIFCRLACFDELPYSRGLRRKLPVMHAATTATLTAAAVADVTPNQGLVNVVAYSQLLFEGK